MADANSAMAVEPVEAVKPGRTVVADAAAEPAAERLVSADAGQTEAAPAAGTSREASAAPSTAATPGPGDDDGMANNELPLPIVTDDVVDPRTPAEREALVPVRPLMCA